MQFDGVRVPAANLIGPAEGKGLNIHKELNPTHTIKADPARLQQVLLNLLSNAVKYNAAPKPEIDVRCSVENEFLHIDIQDNGGGITRNEADRVFEKFARGDRAGYDQGAGLGLPISKAIMRAMFGDLVVEFDAAGNSYFRVSLPLVQSHR